MLPISFDYRLDPPDAPPPDDREDYEAWLDSHSDITYRGFLSPDDFTIPASASEWADMRGMDLEEPEGWADDWRDLA